MTSSTLPIAARADGDQARELLDRLSRVQAGDTGALGELFSEFGDVVYRAAYRLTARPADAEDVTQDVFIRLPAALRTFSGSAASFPGWLRQVAVRQTLMHLRGGRRRREVSVDAVVDLIGPADDALHRLSIETALAALSDDHRAVFVLKEVEGYAHAEIAAMLGISVASSEVRLHRARRHLRDLLRGSR